jgi:choline-sulfatase
MPDQKTPCNLLIILSDEHNPNVMGWRGHPHVKTPHLDELARHGTAFTQAHCSSPICVPTRAALATGCPIHETGYWDNVDGFDGRTKTWHHVLRERGHEAVSIGKLHYRGHAGDDYGWSESLLPMHIHEGRGEVRMLLRNPPCSIGDGSNMLGSAKAGQSTYNQYDDDICESAKAWLKQKSTSAQPEKPWVLMVSMVAPHFPLTVPQKWFDIYSDLPLHLPKGYVYGVDSNAHPFVQAYSKQSGYNQHFKDESDVRRALAGYYGLVSFLDDKVGQLLQSLTHFGLEANTRVMYLSDHGDNNGARGLWGKSTMYTESVGMPLILRGAGIDAGKQVNVPASHLDVFNTVLDCVGIDAKHSTASPYSQSLLAPLDEDRLTLSEYHTVGSTSAIFMLRNKQYKYVHYVDLPPQLFDLFADPEEMNDLAANPNCAALVREWSGKLHLLLDPVAVDRRAKARQAELIEQFGGESAIRSGQMIGGYTPAPIKS